VNRRRRATKMIVVVVVIISVDVEDEQMWKRLESDHEDDMNRGR
jgi:hypothetical protein